MTSGCDPGINPKALRNFGLWSFQLQLKAFSLTLNRWTYPDAVYDSRSSNNQRLWFALGLREFFSLHTDFSPKCSPFEARRSLSCVPSRSNGLDFFELCDFNKNHSLLNANLSGLYLSDLLIFRHLSLRMMDGSDSLRNLGTSWVRFPMHLKRV